MQKNNVNVPQHQSYNVQQSPRVTKNIDFDELVTKIQQRVALNENQKQEFNCINATKTEIIC